MPAKAVRSLSPKSPRPQGRPPSDRSISSLFEEMADLGERLTALRNERAQLADSADPKLLRWNRVQLNETVDAWWTAVDRLCDLPARSWSGMTAKASAINSTIQERETGEDVTDLIAADTIIRLGASLADDVLRWSGKRT